MNVLSLFDGMSCLQIALNRAGIAPAHYYASEIDKPCITVTQANYPNTEQLGSLTEWRSWDIDWSTIDLISGGFPCQSWSVAGKHLGDKDERGMLFWVMLDIIKHAQSVNPHVNFLMENVKMKQEFEQYITRHTEEALGPVHKVLINSALLSAQRRTRYYWTSWPVAQPQDKGLQFQSILESDHARIEKATALTRTYYKGGGEATRQRNFAKSQRPIAWIDDENTRHLTPIECERLQTIPDNYSNHVSKTQRYMMIGNAFTVDVIAHILKQSKLVSFY